MNNNGILVLFFALSFLAGAVVMLSGNKALTRAVILVFVAVHVAFTMFCWYHLDETALGYFTFDRIGVLLMSVLSVLTITTVYHGFIYVKDDAPRTYSIYHTALIALVTAMSGAYLANGMTIVWIFV